MIDSYTSQDDSVDYTYDPTGQLIDADYDTQTDESFEYDANGNQLQFTIGANNQILCDGLYWYSYDAEGSRTEKYQWTDANADGIVDDNERFDLTTYSWDARGRLIKITTRPDGQQATKTVKYEYDYLNRRTDKQIKSTDETGKKTKSKESYTYLGHDIVLQQNDGEQSHRYLHHPDIIDQCLADESIFDDNVLYPLFDNLNSVRDIADYDPDTDLTDIVNSLAYSTSGAIVAEADPTIDHIFGHAGRQRDDESKLLGNGERYYDPDLLCFISEDPIGFFAHDTNLYRYVHNSPVTFVDPTGLEETAFPVYGPPTWEQHLEMQALAEFETQLEQLQGRADLLESLGQLDGVTKEEFIANQLWWQLATPQERLEAELAIYHQRLAIQQKMQEDCARNGSIYSITPDQLEQSEARAIAREEYEQKLEDARFDPVLARWLHMDRVGREHGAFVMMWEPNGPGWDLVMLGAMAAPRRGPAIDVPPHVRVAAMEDPGYYNHWFAANGLRPGQTGFVSPRIWERDASGKPIVRQDLSFCHGIGARISQQKQLRHLFGHRSFEAGKGYFNSLNEAQGVLDAARQGNAQFLGFTQTGGYPVFRCSDITGYHFNPRHSDSYQPTHIFFIKGTVHPSIVPANPNWGL